MHRESFSCLLARALSQLFCPLSHAPLARLCAFRHNQCLLMEICTFSCAFSSAAAAAAGGVEKCCSALREKRNSLVVRVRVGFEIVDVLNGVLGWV